MVFSPSVCSSSEVQWAELGVETSLLAGLLNPGYMYTSLSLQPPSLPCTNPVCQAPSHSAPISCFSWNRKASIWTCKPWCPNMLFWPQEPILDSAQASPKEPEGDSEFSHLAPLAPLPVEPSYEQVQSVSELKWSCGLVLLCNHSILLQFPLDCSLGSQWSKSKQALDTLRNGVPEGNKEKVRVMWKTRG